MKPEVIQKLFKIAQRQAKNNQFSLDDNVESELIYFITIGVDKLSASQLKDEETIKLAERNIKDFVDLMSRNADRRLNRRSLDSGYIGFMVYESLDISSFNLAMRGFCPRFPFC